jgi:hypothetical protein
MQLLDAFVKYVEIERTTYSAGTARDQIQEGLQQMLESLPYATIGVANQKQLPEFELHGCRWTALRLLQFGENQRYDTHDASDEGWRRQNAVEHVRPS